MLKFSIETIGLDEINDKMSEACTQAEHLVAIQVAKDTSPYVPFLTGSLSNRTRVIADTVIYPGPYARYLYYGKLMVDPETGSAWARKGATKILTQTPLNYNRASHVLAQDHWFEASKAMNLEKWMDIARKAVARYG